MSSRKPKRRLESFESWCRRARILSGDPTPAVSSPRNLWSDQATGAFSTTLKGPDTMPALATTLEIFCLRTGRSFRARGSAVRLERYEMPGSLISHYRHLVACKHCSDTHLLLNEYQAACFELLGGPIDGRALTSRDRAFGRRGNRSLFERRRFPPVENVADSATEAA
jgi:hypothetical protein